MTNKPSPLLTLELSESLQRAARSGQVELQCSLDLERSQTTVHVDADSWSWQGQWFPQGAACKPRTIYHWVEGAFEPVSRYAGSLIKLVPTQWGPPTFEIDGIKMLPTSKVSPYVDAQDKVALIQPGGKRILDTCGGLGYFAEWCVRGRAREIVSFEKNPSVVWLRSLNPWSPQPDPSLSLTEGDVTAHIGRQPDESFDAILHDPPRFGIAGELYSQIFYDQLARVLKRQGKLFHYTGTPNRLTSGRDVPEEVSARLQRAGFSTQLQGDGVLAVKKTRRPG